MADQLTPEQQKLPEALRKQIVEADAIRAQMNGDAPPADGQPPQQDDQPPAQQPPAQQPPGEQPPPDDQSWEQRFKSQQGRLETLSNTNRALNERLNHFENLIATMEARGQQQPANAPPPAPTKVTLVTDQERADFGDELLGVMGKRAREELVPEYSELKMRLDRIEGRVDGVGKVIAKERTDSVFGALQAQIPDWDAINHSQEFHQWLAQPDTFSGRIRHDMLKEAFARQEAGRVVAFFKGFLTEATGLPSTPSSPGNSAPPLPGNGQGSGKPSLEDFAAPGRARSAPAGQLPPDKPVYTTASVSQFYAERRTGKWKGREAEADAIERDIFQAQHEGRFLQ